MSLERRTRTPIHVARRTQGLAPAIVACYVLGVFVFLYLEVFTLPRTPVLAVGDQSIYLTNAARMLRGEIIYRDFFQFTPPGTESVYAALFRLFGIRAWIPQGMLIVVGVSLSWLSLVISRRVVKGSLVLLPGLLFLTLAFSNTLDGTHHWYSILAIMAALAVAIKSRSPARLVAVGLLCGLATWFTQCHGLGAILGFAFFVWWEHGRSSSGDQALLPKAEAWLFGSFLTALVGLNAYFVLKVGVHRFVFCTVEFGLEFFSADSFNTWRVYMTELPPLRGWQDLPGWGSFLLIHALTPLVYLLFFVRYRRLAATQRREPWDELMLVSIVGLFLFASVAPAPGYLRMCSISLPALMILAWLVSIPEGLERLLLIALWSIAIALLVAEPVQRQHQWRGVLDLPTGRTAFLDPDRYVEYRWLAEHTHPLDTTFGSPLACFALGLRNPTQIDFATASDYTRPEQVDNVVSVLKRERVRWVFWCPTAYVQPGSQDHLGPIRAYLRSQYHVSRVFGGCRELWEPNP